VKAIVFESESDVRLRDVPTPSPGEDSVLIRVGACGICGSDLHTSDIKDFELPYPYVPGHEVAGAVVEVGDSVEGIEPGDHVVVQPLITCGWCPPCRRGQVNLCRHPNVIGLHRPGGFAEYLTAPAENVYASTDLPDTVAASTEPLACSLHGLRRLNPRVGDHVLILGAGGIGLLFLQLIQRRGAGRVTVVDMHPHRLEAARELGADRTILADGSKKPNLTEAEPTGFECVVDATGVPNVVEAALHRVAPGGKLLMLGSCPTEASISVRPRMIQSRDATVMGSIGFGFEFLSALRLLREGRVRVEPIVTHRYPLEQFADGLELARSGRAGIKIQITPG
jgi:NADPH2:quinone reductase